MAEVLLTIGTGVIVGLALGLTGGGGSIFAVPLLIYVLGVAPAQAVPVSLAAVALTALAGAIHAIRAGLPAWTPALVFAAGGAIGSPFGIGLARRLDERVIVGGFALLAMIVGIAMWLRTRRKPDDSFAVRARPEPDGTGPVCSLTPEGQLRFNAPCAAVLTAVGIGTGLLSGLFGVGGGFLIVPALVTITRMGIHRAVATSLIVIAAIGFAGAAGALWTGQLTWPVLLPFAAGGMLGMLLGRMGAARVSGPRLQQAFAGLVVMTGVIMLAEAILSRGTLP